MPKRKKYPKLPNGFGSIKYLGTGRRNPYAVHPPTKEFSENGSPKTPKALCYVDTWERGFAVLTAYNNGFYYKGYENTLPAVRSNGNFTDLSNMILAEFNRGKGIEKAQTFSQVYDAYYADKFDRPHSKEYSKQLRYSISAAYKKCSCFHDREFQSIRYDDLQNFVDALECGFSTQENVLFLLHQLYSYAIAHDICEKDYSKSLKITVLDDDHGVPFTDDELSILWQHKKNHVVEFMLIMCYSGFRISAYLKDKMEINLDDGFFRGGVKTATSKHRTVPMHSGIKDMVADRMARQGCMLDIRTDQYRDLMYNTLDDLGLEKHTPHDCRHTFSRLCDKYFVLENDKKRMLGHKIGDVTNDVYGHRSLEDLREQIEKIQVSQFVTNQI